MQLARAAAAVGWPLLPFRWAPARTRLIRYLEQWWGAHLWREGRAGRERGASCIMVDVHHQHKPHARPNTQLSTRRRPVAVRGTRGTLCEQRCCMSTSARCALFALAKACGRGGSDLPNVRERTRWLVAYTVTFRLRHSALPSVNMLQHSVHRQIHPGPDGAPG